MRKARNTGLSNLLRASSSDLLNVRRGRALLTLLLVVAHLRALSQRLEAAALNRRVMNEEVLAAFIGGDEAEALVVVEPLDGSCCHVVLPSVCVCELRNAEGLGGSNCGNAVHVLYRRASARHKESLRIWRTSD